MISSETEGIRTSCWFRSNRRMSLALATTMVACRAHMHIDVGSKPIYSTWCDKPKLSDFGPARTKPDKNTSLASLMWGFFKWFDVLYVIKWSGTKPERVWLTFNNMWQARSVTGKKNYAQKLEARKMRSWGVGLALSCQNPFVDMFNKFRDHIWRYVLSYANGAHR